MLGCVGKLVVRGTHPTGWARWCAFYAPRPCWCWQPNMVDEIDVWLCW